MPLATHHWITWQESEINSRGRRAWTAEAAEFLRAAAGPHETFFTSFSDMTAIYRTLGIPLRDTLTGDNDPQWLMALVASRSVSLGGLGGRDGRR